MHPTPVLYSSFLSAVFAYPVFLGPFYGKGTIFSLHVTYALRTSLHLTNSSQSCNYGTRT